MTSPSIPPVADRFAKLMAELCAVLCAELRLNGGLWVRLALMLGLERWLMRLADEFSEAVAEISAARAAPHRSDETAGSDDDGETVRGGQPCRPATASQDGGDLVATGAVCGFGGDLRDGGVALPAWGRHLRPDRPFVFPGFEWRWDRRDQNVTISE